MELDNGVCPVCGGPTKRARIVGNYRKAKVRIHEETEFCWAQCYIYDRYYEQRLVRVGEKSWQWYAHQDEAPEAEIDRAIQELRAAHQDPEKTAFVQAINRDRYDKATRLVYADWLEEHDEPEEADHQRGWTREWQEASDYLLECAVECRITYQELLDTARSYLEGGDGLYLGFITPERMYKSEHFWKHYTTVTGQSTDGDRGVFVRCGC